jgi:hypothetical protein
MKDKTKPATAEEIAAAAQRAADIDRLNRMADEALKLFAPPRPETLQ